jgi:hypothetical protein
MRLSSASLAQLISGTGFRTVAPGVQNGFVESKNNSSPPALCWREVRSLSRSRVGSSAVSVNDWRSRHRALTLVSPSQPDPVSRFRPGECGLAVAETLAGLANGQDVDIPRRRGVFQGSI